MNIMTWPPKDAGTFEGYIKADIALMEKLYRLHVSQPPQPRKFPADRTRSPRWRAGSRRNKRIKNVRPFFSDWWTK